MKPPAFKNNDNFASEPSSDDSLSGTPMGVQVLSFICGLVVAYFGFQSIQQDYRLIHKLTHLESLQMAPAKILQVKIRKDSTGSENECYPDVLYEYFMDGKSIWGWRLSFEEEPRSRSYWEARLAHYKVGDSTQAYFDPALPKDAILEKKHGNIFRAWTKMALGGAFILVGITLVLIPMLLWIKQLFTAKPSALKK